MPCAGVSNSSNFASGEQLIVDWCRLLKVSLTESEQGLTCWLEHLALVSFSVWQAGSVEGCSGSPTPHEVPSKSSGKPHDDGRCLLAHSSPHQTDLPCRRPPSETSMHQACLLIAGGCQDVHHVDSVHAFSNFFTQSAYFDVRFSQSTRRMTGRNL